MIGWYKSKEGSESMYISITGGTKKQKQLVKEVAQWAANEVLGKRLANVIDIDFEIKKKLDADGWCEWLDDNLRPREFKIQVRAEQSMSDMVVTICHEMVHVRQMARSELKEIYRGGHYQVWKGKKLPIDTKYEDQPWEKEAYKMQTRLAKKCVTETGVISVLSTQEN